MITVPTIKDIDPMNNISFAPDHLDNQYNMPRAAIADPKYINLTVRFTTVPNPLLGGSNAYRK
jgi:hypothetical protein